MIKLTPVLIERIVTVIQTTDLPLSRIAEDYCQITEHTLRNWIRNGEKYKQQLEEGKIRKSDLNTQQKREMKLYTRVGSASAQRESEYLQKIHDIATEKKDIRALQWLLEISHKDYRVDDVEDDTSVEKETLYVVSLSDENGQAPIPLSEFMQGIATDADEQGDEEDTSDNDMS